MFFYQDYFLRNPNKITEKEKYENSYKGRYEFWYQLLFDNISGLFKWDSLPETIPSRQIEYMLGMLGYCGIAKHKDGNLIAMFGTLSNPTYYYNEFSKFCGNSPNYSNMFDIGVNCEIIYNNMYGTPYKEIIENYATQLAHIDVTITFTLIGARDNGGIPIVKTEKQKQSMLEYQAKVFNGSLGVVSDYGDFGIEYQGMNRGNSQNIVNLIVSRERLLRAFRTEFGIKSVFDKNSIAISNEIDGNNELLEYNQDLMLQARQLGVDKVNSLFGTDIKVSLNPILRYKENLDETQDNRDELSDNSSSVGDKQSNGDEKLSNT